jgi:Zn-dependent peptidase ImmA (M78 family)
MQEKIKMELSNQRKVELSELAEFISMEYCPQGIIYPEIIAKQSKISYNYGDYGDCFDGLLEKDERSFHIYLNNQNKLATDNPRIRFSFAHELGHYFIDEHRNAMIKGKSLHKSYNQFLRKNIVEVEADFFASNLLMPKCYFRKSIGNKKFSADLINDLKTEYKISFTACAIRLMNIDIHPFMIVFAEKGHIKWKYSSADFPYKWLINDSIVPNDTVMGEYCYQKKTEELYKTVTVWAIDWFNPNYAIEKTQYICIKISNA